MVMAWMAGMVVMAVMARRAFKVVNVIFAVTDGGACSVCCDDSCGNWEGDDGGNGSQWLWR